MRVVKGGVLTYAFNSQTRKQQITFQFLLLLSTSLRLLKV